MVAVIFDQMLGLTPSFTIWLDLFADGCVARF
jgi:hypothetical protein